MDFIVMKTKSIFVSLSFTFLLVAHNAQEQPELFLIDKIEVVVFGKEDVEIITKSDVDKPSLGGGFRSKEDVIFEKEVLLDAKQHKIPDDEEQVDAYLAQIQRENNLSPSDLEDIFTASGYTLEEGRQQLQVMQTVNTMLDVKIRSNLIVPRRDVEHYYNEHPAMIEAAYTLERLFVPQSKKMSKNDQRRQLVTLSLNKKEMKNAQWSEPFTIGHSDIAENKHFIYAMEPGDISAPQAVDGGFELFRLAEKIPQRLRTLEESYREITDILRRPKYEELMLKYREQLARNSSVVFF
jgi:PPIC-type PPIASE domain